MTLPMAIIFFVLLLAAVPISFAMILAGIVSVETFTNYPAALFHQRLLQPTQSFPLLAIPFFIVAGNLLMTGSLGRDLLTFAQVLVGRFRGGLGHVSILGSFMFGGVSGSAVADASAVGSALIPMQKKAGYSAGFAGAINASSSTLSLLIPPSIPLILFSASSNASIGALFIAGLIPGILLALGQFLTCYLVARRMNVPLAEHRYSRREKLVAFLRAAPPLLLVLGIVASLRFGLATPTEISVLATVYALVVRIIVYRDINLHRLFSILRSSATLTGTVMLIIMASYIWSWILTTEHIPEQIAQFAIQNVAEPWMLILAMNIVMLIVGTFLDLPPAILLLAPIFIPIAQAAGMSDIQLGVTMVVNLAIGLYTPPVGTTLFISSVIGKCSIGDIVRMLWPFYIAALVVLGLVSYLPWTTTALL